MSTSVDIFVDFLTVFGVFPWHVLMCYTQWCLSSAPYLYFHRHSSCEHHLKHSWNISDNTKRHKQCCSACWSVMSPRTSHMWGRALLPWGSPVQRGRGLVASWVAVWLTPLLGRVTPRPHSEEIPTCSAPAADGKCHRTPETHLLPSCDCPLPKFRYAFIYLFVF